MDDGPSLEDQIEQQRAELKVIINGTRAVLVINISNISVIAIVVSVIVTFKCYDCPSLED
jgi:hypothetical protein